MKALFYKEPRQFMMLAHLVAQGGTGYLNPTLIARSSGLARWALETDISRLKQAKRIEAIDGERHLYGVVGRAQEDFVADAPPEELPAKVPANIREVTADDFKVKTPTAAAFAVVNDYHETVKRGGDYYKAAESVQSVLDGEGGWTVERLRACMTEYRRQNREDRWRMLAPRFFAPLPHGLFQGAQWEPRADAQSASGVSPRGNAEVNALADKLKKKAAA